MRLNLPPALWPLAVFDAHRLVVWDAEALINTFGSDAAAVAERRSSQEDLGLLATRRPGHWSRVAGEIGRRARRAGQPAMEPVA